MRKPRTFMSVVFLAACIACVVGASAAGRTLDAPTITGVSPNTGFAGAPVVITGTNLTGATVSFKLKKPGAQPILVTPANTTVNASGTRITVLVPDGGDAAEGHLVRPGKNGVWV